MSPLPAAPLIPAPPAGSLVTSNTTMETGPNNTMTSSTRTETRPLGVSGIIGIVLGVVGILALVYLIVFLGGKLIKYHDKRATDPQYLLNKAYKEERRRWRRAMRKRARGSTLEPTPAPPMPLQPIAVHCPNRHGGQELRDLSPSRARQSKIEFVAPPAGYEYLGRPVGDQLPPPRPPMV
ncbi:hypothetical protein N7528_010219 [Penicillium herquei]|nr:hypothetical protein N7528_010219 [Penicillium herquei]